MSLQYMADKRGRTTGVFMPVSAWDKLRNKFEGIELEAIAIGMTIREKRKTSRILPFVSVP